MQLTQIAEKLKQQRDDDEGLTPETEALATCMGSEDFCYALYEGGYLKPEEWINGEDLIKLKNAIEIVGKFKDLVTDLHEEI